MNKYNQDDIEKILTDAGHEKDALLSPEGAKATGEDVQTFLDWANQEGLTEERFKAAVLDHV